MKPILFSTPMVRAILAGRKTMTRRVEKDVTSEYDYWGMEKDFHVFGTHNNLYPALVKPQYQFGDILWVRETWTIEKPERINDWQYVYRADDEVPNGYIPSWRPSIFMPREAARIFLRVTDVRVERLQDIDNDDAIKEGCAGAPCDCLRLGRGWMGCESCMNTGWQEPPTVEFMQLWEHLNAKRGYGWDTNPWVWVYSFERIRICDMLPSEAITAGCILQSKGDV